MIKEGKKSCMEFHKKQITINTYIEKFSKNSDFRMNLKFSNL